MIGTLGDVVFTASTEKVLTFRDFARSGGPRLEEHPVIGRKPTLEVIGPGLDQVSFSIRLDSFLGVKPGEELAKLRAAREEARILSMSIGGEYLGRWIIAGMEEAHTRHNGKGEILVAEVSLSLKEVAEDPPAAGGLLDVF